jgi:sulfatase modifying factor 1
MSGNVWEWVWDRLGAYSADPQRDPAGPERGETRILRGGSWRYEARYARVADRNWSRPGYRSPAVGFRLARSSSAGDLDALVSEE